MIAVARSRQIIRLRATVGLIPRARRFRKEKNTGFEPSSHIVWKNDRKTHLFRKSSFSPTSLSRLLGVESAVGVSDEQLAQQLAEESRHLDSFLRHFAPELVLSL